MSPHQRPWKAVADDLRSAISAGHYRAGDPLPSGRELMSRYEIARQTLQNAIDQLKSEGLVASVPGRGWAVARRPEITRLARNRLSQSEREAGRGAFMTDAHHAGFKPSVETDVRREIAPTWASKILSLEDGQAVVRDRTMSADNSVVMLATSYFPADIAVDTAVEQVDTGRGGVYKRLEDLGWKLTNFEEGVTSRYPTGREADLLELPYGYPVLEVTRVAWAHTRAVEVNLMVMAGDKYQLVYAWPAE